MLWACAGVIYDSTKWLEFIKLSAIKEKEGKKKTVRSFSPTIYIQLMTYLLHAVTCSVCEDLHPWLGMWLHLSRVVTRTWLHLPELLSYYLLLSSYSLHVSPFGYEFPCACITICKACFSRADCQVAMVL